MTSVLLVALIVSLGVMKPGIALLGFHATPTDALFVALSLSFAWAVATRRARVTWDPAFGWLALYLGAMLVSALVAGDWQRSGPKLATQVYLVGLAVLMVQLVSSEALLRRAIMAWLAGTGFVVAVGIASLASFVIDPFNPFYAATAFQFGTLPPGAYPRLGLTFLNANMACNYLTVSVVLLLLAHHLGWLAKRIFLIFLVLLLLASASTISPGLGGILLALGLWRWLAVRGSRAGRIALGLGLAAALAFVAAMAVTPILHPTSPFLITIPGTSLTLAPAGRLLTWLDAVHNLLANPLFGRGIGADAVGVAFVSPSGEQYLTDAHNSFLNIAAQCGLVGLAALIALTLHAWRRARPWTLAGGDRAAIRTALGLSFLVAFAYEGLGGSFEDARHLWVLFGLLIAAARLGPAAQSSSDT